MPVLRSRTLQTILPAETFRGLRALPGSALPATVAHPPFERLLILPQERLFPSCQCISLSEDLRGRVLLPWPEELRAARVEARASCTGQCCRLRRRRSCRPTAARKVAPAGSS